MHVPLGANAGQEAPLAISVITLQELQLLGSGVRPSRWNLGPRLAGDEQGVPGAGF